MHVTNIVTTTELITPQIAKRYLEKNNNRKVKWRHVASLARIIIRGEWVLTPHGIAFGPSGELLDGQHRLLAVIESGVSVYMRVSRNVAVEAMIAIDTMQKTRTVMDASRLAYGVDLNKDEIAVLNTLNDLVGPTRMLFSHQQMIDLHKLFKEGVEWVLSVSYTSQKGISVAAVRSAMLMAWCYEDSISRLEQFYGILSGKITPQGDQDVSALKLRDQLLTASSKSNIGRKSIYLKTQRAIKAFCKYESLKVIKEPVAPVYAWPLVQNIRGPKTDDLLQVLYTGGSSNE
jgi:hypothetical protein